VAQIHAEGTKEAGEHPLKEGLVQRTYWMADRGELERILERGAQTAQEVAQPLVDAVYEKVGFLPRPRR